MNISKTNCDMLEIAGLLHDIGKLRTPDDYLEKPSKLTDEEFAMLRRHSFDTYKILQAIDGLEDIAMWASQHHEHIDGSGYPKHLKESELSQEARILAVADVFQALAQNRPYRAPLEPEEILNILQKEVEKSHLDESVVNCVSHHLEDCWRTALLINKHP
jgi:HD-GYP domain-containing protein (c-di-GMP phosphodiesterase class II)